MSNGTSDAVGAPRQHTERSSAWAIYLAGGVGAFCLGFGDLAKNNDASTVLKMSEVIRRHLYPEFAEGALAALVLLVVLGMALCWIHNPSNRVDAFSRGLSVFAVLAVASPVGEAPGPLSGEPAPPVLEQGAGAQTSAPAGFVTVAFVGQPTSAPLRLAALAQGSASIHLDHLAALAAAGSALPVSDVTVRDVATGKLVAKETVRGTTVEIERSVGTYLVQIETEGYRTVEVQLTLEGPYRAYAIEAAPSAIPRGLQKLYGPVRIVPEALALSAESRLGEIEPRAKRSELEQERTTRGGSRFWRYSLWLEMPDNLGREVESVEYFFDHPTFKISRVTSRSASSGFSAAYIGYSCINDITISVLLKTGARHEIRFNLCDYLAPRDAVT